MKTRMRRGFVLVCVLSAFSVAMAEDVTLRFCWWGGSVRHEATLEALKYFEEHNPEIKIKSEYMGWPGYLERITVQFGSGSEPDLIQMNWAWLDIFSRDGNGLYDLGKVAEHIDLAQYDPKWFDTTTVKGKLNALPVSFTTQYFFWNATMWERAGLPLPETWDDLLAAGPVFTEKFGDNHYPMDSSRNGSVMMTHCYIYQKTGKMIIDPATGEIGLSRDEIIDWLSFYKKLVDNRSIPSLESRASRTGTSETPTNETDDFIEGRWAGAFNWDSTIALLQKVVKPEYTFKLGEFLTQTGAKSSGRIGRPSMIFAIGKNTKHPVETAKVLSFLLTSPEAAKILKVTRGNMLGKDAFATLVQDNLITPMNLETIAQLEGAQVAAPHPAYEDPRVNQILNDVIEQIDYGKMTVEQGADDMISRLHRILRRINR